MLGLSASQIANGAAARRRTGRGQPRFMEAALMTPPNAPTQPLSQSARSTPRQNLIAAHRFDCVSLTRAEFELLTHECQEEYRRQVRAARPELYRESSADILQRWRSNWGRACDHDYQKDHDIALREGERDIGEKL
jgi:hypothetical protein